MLEKKGIQFETDNDTEAACRYLEWRMSQGDTLEAAFALRAYRSTKPRLLESPVQDTANMRCIRRISSAFKEVPGGQYLGATYDYALRLLQLDLANEDPAAFKSVAQAFLRDTAESIEQKWYVAGYKILKKAQEGK